MKIQIIEYPNYKYICKCGWSGKDSELEIIFYTRGPGDPPGNYAVCPMCQSAGGLDVESLSATVL